MNQYSRYWLLVIEEILSHACDDMDIEGGGITVHNTAVHLVGGVRYDF